jgi:hypothetical protein
MSCTPLSQIYASSDFAQQMKDFIDGWDAAVTQFEEEFDKATEDFDKKLAATEKAVKKLECLPQILFDKNPALKRLAEQAGYFLGITGAIKDVKNLVRNSASMLKALTIEALQNIPLPNLRGMLGDFFDALDKVNEAFKTIKAVSQAALELINGLAGIALCLLDPIVEPDPEEEIDETDPSFRLKEELKEFNKKVIEGQDYIDGITDKLDLISNLFSGEGCIDITS